jgi:hypothetical protein
LALTGCGKATQTVTQTVPGQQGCLTPNGICKAPQAIKPTTQLRKARTFPDVWEGDPYTTYHGPQVIRLSYGDHFYDHHVYTNAARLRSWGVWFGGYVYLTGNGCTREAEYTVRELGSIGAINGPVIPDGEITLPRGYVACFENYIRAHTRYPTVEYTGCYSGIERIGRVWVPDYGATPPCGPRLAWQYSEAAVCGEPWAGDCSVDEGITAIGPAKPKPPPPSLAALLHTRALLRADLTRHRCRVAPYHGRGRYHAVCAHWLSYGASVNRQIKALGGH